MVLFYHKIYIITRKNIGCFVQITGKYFTLIPKIFPFPKKNNNVKI